MRNKKPLTPNFDDRPETAAINMLVMHYTGMKTGKEALDRMCDPEAKVSAHYMVYEDGTIVQLVDEYKRAWHAGISCWHGISSLNDTSIGIEIVNPGHEWGYVKFPKVQMRAVRDLSLEIIKRHNIEARNVVGHSDIAPLRKEDPGELFRWRWLAKSGVGLWPKTKIFWQPDKVLVEPSEESVAVGRVQTMLSKYGYHIKVDGFYGPKTEKIVKEFKRHFVPEQLNVYWDKLADARMRTLLEMVE